MVSHSQPKALPYLFLTEMWERFGFYVVQGMLVLYMTQAFGFTDSDSYTIMGVFSALAYISPFLGGIIADRILGFKLAIFIGGIFLSVGYAMLALPWQQGFYFSLSTIIIGNGLFKPNVSSLLGSLYQSGDPQRDSGFTIFYIGINLGALLAGFSSGYIKDYMGWHAGFAIASVGLLFGLGVFKLGIKHIQAIKAAGVNPPIRSTFSMKVGVVGGCVVGIFVIRFLLQSQLLAKWLLPIAGIVLLVYLLITACKEEPPYRQRMLSLIALILSSVVFWMFYLQLFFSANLFIDRLVDRTVLGLYIPTTVFYALTSVFIILLGPAFAWSWHSLNQNELNPSPFIKFMLAIIFAGLCFLVLGVSTFFADANHLVNPLWVVFAYLLITIGELLLSPIGLSAVTTLTPRRLVGMMMGIWFVATGFGGQFAGMLAKLSNIPASVTSIATELTIYRGAFMDFAYIAFGVAFLLFVMYMILRLIFANDRKQQKML